jgi:hypothetical protein
MSSIARILALGTCLISSLASAQSPFDGTWKLNTQQSNLAGEVMTLQDAGGGAITYSDPEQSYRFKPDGSPVTTPLGSERTYLKNADGSYTSTLKRHGTLLRTDTWNVSSDGNTLKIEAKGTKPNGDAFDDLTTYTRTAPGSGILGGWKSTEVKLSSPNSLSIKTDGDSVAFTISAMKVTCQVTWDGKDHGCTGPTVPDGVTLSVLNTGPTTFKLVEKKDGKPLGIVRYRVSRDGKTLYAKGTDGEGKEAYTEVWEKQL